MANNGEENRGFLNIYLYKANSADDYIMVKAMKYYVMSAIPEPL